MLLPLDSMSADAVVSGLNSDEMSPDLSFSGAPLKLDSGDARSKLGLGEAVSVIMFLPDASVVAQLVRPGTLIVVATPPESNFNDAPSFVVALLSESRLEVQLEMAVVDIATA